MVGSGSLVQAGWRHLLPEASARVLVPVAPGTVQKPVKKFKKRFDKHTPEQQELLRRLFDNKTGVGNKALLPQTLQAKRKDAPTKYKLPPEPSTQACCGNFCLSLEDQTEQVPPRRRSLTVDDRGHVRGPLQFPVSRSVERDVTW